MKKNKIINNIEKDLSELFYNLDYKEYVYFIKRNKLLLLYDLIIDTPYDFLLNENILNKIQKIIKNKKVRLSN